MQVKNLINKGWKRLVVAGVVAAMGTVGIVAISSAAVKPDCKTLTYPLCNRSVAAAQVVDNSLPESKLAPEVRVKLNKVGTPGTNGKDSIVTVTADTMVTNRPDTGTDGTVWAKDNMTRSLSLTKQSAAEASKCGSGAVRCFFYTGTIKDAGTFTTIDGAHSPNASGTNINGVNIGTVNGVYAIEFYASTDQVNPSLVDATISGSAPSTSDWMKLAFPAGTKFSALGGIDYTWQYNLAATCETHTQTTAANTGNITGVSKCS